MSSAGASTSNQQFVAMPPQFQMPPNLQPATMQSSSHQQVLHIRTSDGAEMQPKLDDKGSGSLEQDQTNKESNGESLNLSSISFFLIKTNEKTSIP
jgi:hypothetical protein